jgi:hypothetical protein
LLVGNDPVFSTYAWQTNAHLILDCVNLYYLRDGDHVLDPTWGKGGWWTLWQPNKLTGHDLYTLDEVDFRNLPHADSTFDAVAFDPPYVSVGGRVTSGMPGFQSRYGMDRSATTPRGQQEINNVGLAECYRVVKPHGYVLTKCQNYVSSGKLWLGEYEVTRAGLALGFKVQDILHHVGNPRPQPAIVRQQHARRNESSLIVFQK